MSEVYSSFKPYYNFKFDSDSKQPKFIDRNAVILDGKTPIPFEVAIFVNTSTENEANERRPDYRVKLTPKNPSLRARQADYMNGSVETPRPPNAPSDWDKRRRAGFGSLWIVSDEEQQASQRRGDQHIRTFSGNAVVLLPSGVVAIDAVLFGRYAAENTERAGFDFHSGALNLHDPRAAAAARATKQGNAGEPTRPAAPGQSIDPPTNEF